MNIAETQFCNDFSSNYGDEGVYTKKARIAADEAGLVETFRFNRFTQGYLHAARGDDNQFPDNPDYTSGYDTALLQA